MALLLFPEGVRFGPATQFFETEIYYLGLLSGMVKLKKARK
jgi:hypothetical protein